MLARLLWIEGEGAAEFADLIGCEGEVSRKRSSVTFSPAGRGDWLTLSPVDESRQADRWRLTSRTGLTYVFKIL